MSDGVDRSEDTDRGVAIGCQGGGSHTAYTAGVLAELAPALAERRLSGISGTSGGAICALLAWYGLVIDGPDRAAELLETFWERIAARSPADAVLNEATVSGAALEAGGAPIPEVSPYFAPPSYYGRARLRAVLESLVDFDAIPALVGPETPALHVGAVDVTRGRFEVFVDGEVTVEAVLASTALPTLFPATYVDGRAYWDGLFAENPPVVSLLERPADRAPEELWVVRVNPVTRDAVPRSLREIADRRNELAGNLSLRKDLAAIERVNEWLAAGYLPSERYDHVEVKLVGLDRDLPLSSKLDRDPTFLAELFEVGRRDAATFPSARS